MINQFNKKNAPNPTLSLQALCNEVELYYHAQIKKASGNIVAYLQKNEQIESLLPAVSDLVHIIYYKLHYEIRLCIGKEKRMLFPLITAATEKDIPRLPVAMEPFRKKHELIMQLAVKLRQILGRYEILPGYSKEFIHFNNELRQLDSIIYKWIYVEKDLIFPKVCSDLAKEKFIATVFR